MPATYRYPFENEDDYKARVIFSLVKTETTGEAAGESFSAEINALKQERAALEIEANQLIADLETDEISEADYKSRIKKSEIRYEPLPNRSEIIKVLNHNLK